MVAVGGPYETRTTDYLVWFGGSGSGIALNAVGKVVPIEGACAGWVAAGV